MKSKEGANGVCDVSKANGRNCKLKKKQTCVYSHICIHTQLDTQSEFPLFSGREL